MQRKCQDRLKQGMEISCESSIRRSQQDSERLLLEGAPQQPQIWLLSNRRDTQLNKTRLAKG